MASQFIGVIRNYNTGQIIAVINPDDDAELDNPRLLLFKGEQAQAVEIVKLARGDYEGALSMDQVAELVERAKAT